MISPELLRRYPFFGLFNDAQLKALAMIAEEISFSKETIIFKENTPATKLYLLLEGEVDLFYSGGGEGAAVDVLVGSIASGEAFGVSALVEPYEYIATAKCSGSIKAIEIEATSLRALCEIDAKLGCTMMRQVAVAMLDRLKYTQVELAAARL